MGSTSSKEEEIIISQAGNNGGVSNNSGKENSWSAKEILIIIFLCMGVLMLVYFSIKKIISLMNKQIRKEIARNNQIV